MKEIIKKIKTTKFGELMASIIRFKGGIPGFETLTDWTLIQSPGGLFYLQSVKKESLRIPLVRAKRINPEKDEHLYYQVFFIDKIEDIIANTQFPIMIKDGEGEELFDLKGSISFPIYDILYKKQ